MSKPPPQIFEYTLKLINIIIKNEEPQNPPIKEINLHEHLQEDNFWPLTVFDRSNETFQFWRGDLVGFKDDYYELNQIDIDEIDDDEENIFSCILSRGISILRGEDHCYLCFNEGEQFKSNYKVVDPITNTIKTIGNIEELINSKFCIESKNISNFIDNESIKQITFICFEEFLLSSIAANQYLTWFVQNTNEYNVSCLLGLIVFSNESKIISPLVLPWENVDRKICGEPKSNDKSCLWDAISFACDQLDENGNVYKKAVKRILVISNSGNDSLSQLNLQKISIKTLRHKVIIDSIILNETEKSKELATLCHISGGYSFKFKTLEDSLQLFDELSFLDIKYRLQSKILLIEGDRSTQCKYLNTSDMTDDFIQKAIGMAKFDKDIPNSVRFKIQHERKYATPRHICCANWNSNIPDARKRRILRELHAAACCMDEKNSQYDPDIIVLPQQIKLDCWMVFLKGIEDTPYEGKWFCLYVTFPDLYPIEPPNIRFFSAPYHLNISHDGSICFDFLYNSYDPQLHMIDIIQNIKVLFVIPFKDCPLRIDALDDYMNDKSLYMRKAKESAKNVGKNDYHEFLAHNSFINDDVSYDFKIEITDHIPPYMMSQISGKPIQGSFNAYCDKIVLSIENDEDDDDDDDLI